MDVRIGEKWFADAISNVPHSNEAKAYVVGVYSRFIITSDGDLSKDAIVTRFSAARTSGNFAEFQRIGDWILWVDTFCPESIRNRELIESIGRLSYYTCHRIMLGRWKVYEELADNLPKLVIDARIALNNNITPRIKSPGQ